MSLQRWLKSSWVDRNSLNTIEAEREVSGAFEYNTRIHYRARGRETDQRIVIRMAKGQNTKKSDLGSEHLLWLH